ncbi:MAG: HAD-IA family hydrolase [Bryobacterales bacterium]|nr:HAD-IA family hydrolase [Bryobacterales bacterium]
MDLLIFDLDGTLIDSQLDLANSVNAARAQMGFPPLAIELIQSYVGNGAPVLIRRAMGPDASEALVAETLERFLVHYRAHMLDHTHLYPGVRETLDQLRDAGKAMAILTNKPIINTVGIIEGLGLSGHFFRLYGGNSFDQKKPDPIGITTLMAERNTTPDRTVMIGDSGVDIRTARNAGVTACGVTYGFHPDSLKSDPPDWLLDDMRQLLGYLP